MKNSKKYYKIGEISKLFQIGMDSIRYYEEIGILKPYRDPENNYRLYTLDDLRKITTIREMLALNFTTAEIREFEENRSVGTTLELFQKELNRVNDQIVTLLQQKEDINSRIVSMENALSLKEYTSIKVIEFYERPCMMISDQNIPDNYVDYSLIQYMQNHTQRISTIGNCDCYTLDIEGSNPDSDFYRTKNVFFYSKTGNYQSNYSLPAGKYLSLTYTGSLKQTKQLLPSLYQYAKTHHLKVIGDPIEFCHIDNYETDNEAEYVTELQLPVASK